MNQSLAACAIACAASADRMRLLAAGGEHETVVKTLLRQLQYSDARRHEAWLRLLMWDAALPRESRMHAEHCLADLQQAATDLHLAAHPNLFGTGNYVYRPAKGEVQTPAR
jgi:hypothetical protein